MTNSACVKFTFNNFHEKETAIFCLKFEDEVDNTYIFYNRIRLIQCYFML